MTENTCTAIITDHGPRYGDVCGRPISEKSTTDLCGSCAAKIANAKHPRKPNSPWRAWRGGPRPTKEAS